jgi:uncharacterized protein (TIGR02117 family)
MRLQDQQFLSRPADELVRMMSVAVVVLLAGCAAPPPRDDCPCVRLASAHCGGETKTIYLVGHGWHTGLVLRRDDVPLCVWPEAAAFDADWLEVGWGDERFYRADRIIVPLLLKAALLPTASVLHVVGIEGPVEDYFESRDLIELDVMPADFEELCRFIHATYERDERGAPIPLGPGRYGTSLFYRGRGKYYYPKTCNVWTARGLRLAGCRTVPALSVSAGSVLRQARREGRVVQRAPAGRLIEALGGGG